MLAFGYSFSDLFTREGLIRLDATFLEFLTGGDPGLVARLREARSNSEAIAPKVESQLLIDLAPHVDDFIGKLFGIESEVKALAARHHDLAPLYEVRRNFIQRRSLKGCNAEVASAHDGPALRSKIEAWIGPFTELGFAKAVDGWLKDEATFAEQLDTAQKFSQWAALSEAGHHDFHGGILFKTPHKIDHLNLVPDMITDNSEGYPVHYLPDNKLRNREGFKLTDQGTDLAGALAEANYCIWCHNQGKDSCSRGLKEKTADGGTTFKKSPFGITLAGCPLEEKISEFHTAKVAGNAVGAVAIITVDNPMVVGTGHRICNDCMKACIYQKQEPVNIPEAETRTVKDVLELPYGYEVYSLLTRWNPLNIRRPYPQAPSGRRVLVVGMGPAGFTLAHHLMNDGHTVVGIDGLKIEPLAATISGVTPTGQRVPFEPIKDVTTLYEALDDRVMAGFGGVAEYGITVRWNKNFLKLIRLLIERRNEFALFGGVRFGGTLGLDDAFAMGFDHVALCLGAGKPTVLDNLPNGFARGVRTASDFLMALQLTGAAKHGSIANMQLRMPVVVIGGGLTAIDTATESLAYYVVQVEKFLERYETMVAEKGEDAVRRSMDAEERIIADEFITHGRAIRAERDAAKKEARPPQILKLLDAWGGVTLAYRRRLIDSPSYTLNHEEVQKALEEGIAFAEGLTPKAVNVDSFGHAQSIVLENKGKPDVTLPARTVLVAAGTQPNTVLAREDAKNFVLDGKYFRAVDETGAPIKPEKSISKPKSADVLLQKRQDGRFASYFGDLHPSFFGNVVKAMGGAKQGYPRVSKVLMEVQPSTTESDAQFFGRLNLELRPIVHQVNRLTSNIVEVVVRAPAAARQFSPGQFYRLQNFETLSKQAGGTVLAMEGLAMTGAWVDKSQGLLSIIALEMGGSSDLCAFLEPGEPVIMMGPTGTPTEIEPNETVSLVGGGLGNAVLFSIGKAFREKGSKVLYFAGYKKMSDRYKVSEIEAAADVIVWCCDEGPGFAPSRPQDKTFVGNIVQAMKAYATGELGPQPIPFADTDRIIAIGSDRMMAAVARSRHEVLKPFLKEHHFAIGSINSPMQCMMKEICAQCLQPQLDPKTGERSYVFSCFNQDQHLDCVDWSGLNSRLKQNSVQEKLTAQWVDRTLVQLNARTRA